MFKSSITDIFTSEADAYRYGGKEFDRFSGLDLHDFSARWYDQQLGRFTSPDPLQEEYPHLSPYLYCAANPLRYTDPTGMVITVLTKDDQVIFMSHLKKVFGDTFSESFTFTEDGVLQNNNSKYQHTKGEKHKRQRKDLFEGIRDLIDQSYNIKISFVGEGDKNKSNLEKVSENGGGVFDSENNEIIILRDYSKDDIVYSDGQNGYGDEYGKEYTINFNTTTILFHEIGEARIGKAVERSSAVDYENIVRKILGVEKRPYDAAHSPLGIGPTIIW